MPRLNDIIKLKTDVIKFNKKKFNTLKFYQKHKRLFKKSSMIDLEKVYQVPDSKKNFFLLILEPSFLQRKKKEILCISEF